jgi:catechol 2,3-dioxygenase-like lactoylglutathione lyase family enzyme
LEHEQQPHHCWNTILIVPGLGQISEGESTKDVAIIVAAIVDAISTTPGKSLIRSPLMEQTRSASPWPKGIFAITLFVEDLQVAKIFYNRVFGLPVDYQDDNSAVFKFGNTLINLLKTTAAGELVKPAKVARHEDGSRVVLTLHVEDVDALCKELTARGVELLNGPMDRPWGVRTASFKDPGGHIWEIAK